MVNAFNSFNRSPIWSTRVPGWPGLQSETILSQKQNNKHFFVVVLKPHKCDAQLDQSWKHEEEEHCQGFLSLRNRKREANNAFAPGKGAQSE